MQTKCGCCEYPAPIFAGILVVGVWFILSVLCHCLSLPIHEVRITALCFQRNSWAHLKEFRSWTQEWYLNWADTWGWKPSWVTLVFCLGWGEHTERCHLDVWKLCMLCINTQHPGQECGCIIYGDLGSFGEVSTLCLVTQTTGLDPSERKVSILKHWRWSHTGTGCPERLWTLHRWRCSEPEWTWSSVTRCSRPWAGGLDSFISRGPSSSAVLLWCYNRSTNQPPKLVWGRLCGVGLLSLLYSLCVCLN